MERLPRQKYTKEFLEQALAERTGKDTRVVVLGHLLRGGSPNVNYVTLEEVAGRMKAVPMDSDTLQTGRDLGVCFGD